MKHPEQYSVPTLTNYLRAYSFPSPVKKDAKLKVLASVDGSRWEHVSVHGEYKSGSQYTPSWDEMCYIKDQFFEDEQTAIQYHPKKTQYVNSHQHTLHLWRDITNVLDLPVNQ